MVRIEKAGERKIYILGTVFGSSSFFVKKNDHSSLVMFFVLVTIIRVSTAILGVGTRRISFLLARFSPPRSRSDQGHPMVTKQKNVEAKN